MKFLPRWYEKNEYLKAFLNLMQNLNSDVQCEIAIDMLMKSSDMIERDFTKVIKGISSYNPKDYKRWYDKNPNVHLAVESLRDLTDDQRDEIIQEFSDKILNMQKIAFNGAKE